MKVNLVELYLVKIPLQDEAFRFFREQPFFEPNWIPGFRQNEVRLYLLKIGTDAGIEGYSTMHAMGAERASYGALLGQYLLGLNPLDITLINQRIQEMSYIGMRSQWIDCAFWDIIGKALKKPIWQLLGGDGGYVYPYASTGSNNGHDPKKAKEVVTRLVDDGYRGIKLRIKSRDVDAMLKYVGAGREAAGSDIALMVDANQGWPVDLIDETPKWDAELALQVAKGLEQFDMRWLEEPLNRGDFAGLAQLRANTSTPIAGGELNSSWCDFKQLLAQGSLDVYQPDAVLVGGTYAGGVSVTHWIIEAIKRHNAACNTGEQHLHFSPHTWTNGLGFVLALHMYGCIPQDERFLIEYPLEGAWCAERWGALIKGRCQRDKDGKFAIPDGPGLGVELDWKVIRKYGTRLYRATDSSVAKSVLLDRGVKTALYLKEKKQQLVERSAQAGFAVPQPPF